MKTCPTCHQQFDDDYAFCLNDGTKLVVHFGPGAPIARITENAGFCGYCAAPMFDDYAFCKKCGAPRTRRFEEQKKVSVTAETASSSRTWFEKNTPLAIIMACLALFLLVGGLYFALSGDDRIASANNSNATRPSTTNRTPTPMVAKVNTTTVPSNQQSGQTGRLLTDLNIRDEPNKYAATLGIHFRGARVSILESTTYETPEGEMSTWYRVKVFEYGCSANANLGCGKNSPGDSDEGWMNSKHISLD